MKLILALLLFVFLNQSLYSENFVIDYETVLELTIKNSPEIADIYLASETSKANAIEQSLPKNPELSLEYRPYTYNPNQQEEEYQVELSMPVRLSDFGQRQKIKHLLTKYAQSEKDLALLKLAQETKVAYAKVWLLSKNKHSLERAQAKILHLTDKFKNSAGAFSKSNFNLLTAQVARLKAELLGLESKMKRATAEINKKVGRDVSKYTFKEIQLTPINYEITKEEFYKLPSGQRLQLAQSIASARNKLSTLETVGVITPRIAFEHTSDGADQIIAGLSFELPFFDRKQASKIQTSAEYDHASKALAFIDNNTFEATLNALKESANLTLEQTNIYKTKVIPALNKSFNEIQNELNAGQASPAQVVQVLSELISAEERFLDLWTNALVDKIEFSALVGRDF